MASTKLRGHEATGEYYERYHVYERRLTAPEWEPRDRLRERGRGRRGGGRSAASLHAQKTRGGRTEYLRPATVFCFFSSFFLVAFQIVSIFIALFTDPKRGRVFSWYGEPPYELCDYVFPQKIMHFYLGFVVISPLYC